MKNKIIVKHIKEKEWLCSKCGFYFYLEGPCGCFIAPNYCPNCGKPRHTMSIERFVQFKEYDEQCLKI